MNYPFWDIPLLGGSMLIAVIAVVHVIVSHLAVGGGFYLYFAERKCAREKDPRFLAYLRTHARFFMLLTTVFGAVSGVGIWFVIALVSPSATSTLIHIFLYGWAIEWVFFLVEILAVILYVYRFDSLAPESREKLALIYMASAWLSLFIINGVITFMLTPGDYYSSGNFRSAFFNPTFWPSLFFRTVVCVAFAGIFAMFTATFQFEEDMREKAVKYASAYLIPAVIFMPVFALWYFAKLPVLARDILTGGSALILVFANISAGSAFLMLAAGFAHAWIEPRRLSTIFTMLLIIFASTFLATFELAREAVRKPYTLYERMYSNSIYVDASKNPQIDRSCFLANVKWCDIKEVTASNRLAAGREIYRYQCQACHSIDGYNAIRPLVKYWSVEFCEASLARLSELKKFMPPFFGSGAERNALAHFLFSLNDKNEKAGE